MSIRSDPQCKAQGIWLYPEDLEALRDLQAHLNCSASAVVRKAIQVLYEQITSEEQLCERL